jgi:hypothetical protein
MRPGITTAAPFDRTRVSGPTRRAISALSPTATIESPAAATAAAQGRAESSVQTPPYTTRLAGGWAGGL